MSDADTYLFDAHCHLSPSVTQPDIPILIDRIKSKLSNEPSALKYSYPIFNLMSTNANDSMLIRTLAKELRGSINPNYGIHPWYSHLFTMVNYEESGLTPDDIKSQHYGSVLKPPPPVELLSNLPVPVYLPGHIEVLKSYISEATNAGIGEIGLDKSFRVPWCGYLGNSTTEHHKDGMSLCRVNMDHQLEILKVFLKLSLKLKLPISVHCVGAHGKLYDVLSDMYGSHCRIVLHSYSGSADNLRMWLKRFP
ncbi:hypothetical protein CANARDRAFT_219335, partial [[Candida] arabinofermentans NRRL YB-2248]